MKYLKFYVKKYSRVQGFKDSRFRVEDKNILLIDIEPSNPFPLSLIKISHIRSK